eukprot:1409176-Rhodomonas_salina.5
MSEGKSKNVHTTRRRTAALTLARKRERSWEEAFLRDQLLQQPLELHCEHPWPSAACFVFAAAGCAAVDGVAAAASACQPRDPDLGSHQPVCRCAHNDLLGLDTVLALLFLV